METLYVVQVQSSVSGSYYQPDIFQDKSDAIEFANALRNLKSPIDRAMVHLYEVETKEIVF